jgi:hypothetical protein
MLDIQNNLLGTSRSEQLSNIGCISNQLKHVNMDQNNLTNECVEYLLTPLVLPRNTNAYSVSNDSRKSASVFHSVPNSSSSNNNQSALTTLHLSYNKITIFPAIITTFHQNIYEINVCTLYIDIL